MLVDLFQLTESSVLAFALYESDAERETGVKELKRQLTMPVVEFTLSDKQKDPFRLLHTLSVKDRMCVFFYNLKDAWPDVAGYLQLQRETLREIPHAILFWVTPEESRLMHSEAADDFSSWSSGTFDFHSPHGS